jgi:CheY-like chemotaxis protein
MRKVLVVDDSEIILTRVRHALEEIGCQVVTAISGIDAIKAAKEDAEISLVIADILMPGMDGFDTCAKIKEIPGHENTMIMMCTTEASAERKERARKLGASCWLLKPIQFDLLKKAVDKLFEDRGL